MPAISKLELVLDIYPSIPLILRYIYCLVFQGVSSENVAEGTLSFSLGIFFWSYGSGITAAERVRSTLALGDRPGTASVPPVMINMLYLICFLARG